MKRTKKTQTDLKDLANLFPEMELNAEEESPQDATYHIVIPVSYMCGIPIENLTQRYERDYRELLEKLKSDENVTIVRFLSNLRTDMMKHFLEVDKRIRYNLENIDRIEFFNKNEINYLLQHGVDVVQPNYLSEKYNLYFTQLIEQYIKKCEHFFPEWLDFSYIQDLFVAPKYQKPNVLKAEFDKFQANRLSYPFQKYIHFKPTGVSGYLFLNDEKFLKIIYEQHGAVFEAKGKTKDANASTKESIYDFIGESFKAALVVDCENADVCKLLGTLKSLEETELKKIQKIILFDDKHTSPAWDHLNKFVSIPIEHIEVERINNNKSLVDIKMTAGVCKSYYEDMIDSFILVSSDSDFWGLISSLPARFLVLYENDKVSNAIKQAFTIHQIFHCAMDDFYQGSVSDFQKTVLLEELEDYKQNIVGTNAWELTKKLYEKTRIKATEKEMQNFHNKYVKTLQLTINKDGVFEIK